MEVNVGDDCIFCKIISGKIPSKLIHRDDLCVAFDDINPVAPVHSLVVPIEHIDRLSDVGADKKALLCHLMMVVNDIALKKGVAENGYRVVINVGPDGGQIVPHLHIHVIGGKNLNHKMG